MKKVLEYRKKYPNCKFCNHRDPYHNYCTAKCKRIFLNKAKKCSIYFPVSIVTDIEE